MALAVEPTVVGGAWLRHVPAGVAALFRPQPPDDNRWQRGATVDALYLADGEATAWAEWYRHLAERGLPPNAALPRALWRLQVAEIEVADLSSEERLAAVGLPRPAPGRRSWPPFQQIGEELFRLGWSGLLAPSAARPSGRVLCLFLPAAGMSVPITPVGRPDVIRQPPVPPTGMRT